MENNIFGNILVGTPLKSLGARLKSFITFMKKFISKFEVTRQDLIDAGVYLPWMDD